MLLVICVVWVFVSGVSRHGRPFWVAAVVARHLNITSNCAVSWAVPVVHYGALARVTYDTTMWAH